MCIFLRFSLKLTDDTELARQVSDVISLHCFLLLHPETFQIGLKRDSMKGGDWHQCQCLVEEPQVQLRHGRIMHSVVDEKRKKTAPKVLALFSVHVR